MRYRTFGKTGEKISVLGIGAWQAGLKSWGKDYTLNDVKEAIRFALDNGVNFIDTAEIYGNGRSEEVIGGILRDYGDNIFIATKVSGFNATTKRIFESAKRSRGRLGIDAIDLYQVHWPPSIYTDICKTARALEKLVDSGIIRYIGVSNFDLDILKKFRECLKKYDVISNQLQYNLLNRGVEKRLYPYMKREGIELIAWSPIAKGALAGKFKANTFAKKMDPSFKRAKEAKKLFEILNRLTNKYNCKMHQIALAWLIAKGALPIPGVKRVGQAMENIGAADIILDDNDIYMLDESSSKYIEVKFGGVMPRIVPNWMQRIIIGLLGGV